MLISLFEIEIPNKLKLNDKLKKARMIMAIITVTVKKDIFDAWDIRKLSLSSVSLLLFDLAI